MITSVSNPRVKQVVLWRDKAKERKKDKVFVSEGLRICEEAPIELVKEVYLTQGMVEKAKENTLLWKKLEQTGYEIVSDEVFEKMADTRTPQGFLTVLRQPEYVLQDILKKPDGLYLVLENLQDPGNLGTILRTSEGAGVTAVIMSANTVDIFNPKTIRSTMGSVFRVPFLYVEDLPHTLEQMKQAGIHTYAAHLKGTEYYHSKTFKEATAFLIGNEGNGLTKEIADLAESYIKIPMEGQLESLNAAIAASLLVYEAHRQRHS